MKLTGLPNRLYNIVFHTHTVSGIVISFALYVIFFAGTFTIFKSEFYQWENPAARTVESVQVDYEQVLRALKKAEPRFSLTEDITIRPARPTEPQLTIYGHLETPKGQPEIHYTTRYAPLTGQFNPEGTSTIGETLYRLHFFDQVPYFIGRYLSGFVSLFFLFAIVTGVLVHWRNIFSKFYGFSFKGSRKQLWTNAHTVLGMIGLPFQLMYAVTGAFYILSLLILLPVVMLFFGGDQEKAFSMIRPSNAITVNQNAPESTTAAQIGRILSKVKTDYPGQDVQYLQLRNFTREDAVITVNLGNEREFASDGYVSYRLNSGKVELDLMPGKKGYANSVLFGIARLHFATFGGLVLKTIYALLALFTCFVIISGVLLWKEARNKPQYTDRQRQFHRRVTMVYLSICFSLFPAIAILFGAELLVAAGKNHVDLVNQVFFISWLSLSVAGVFVKTEARLTRWSLWSGGVLSLLVPVINGAVTGDWIWVSLQSGNLYVAWTDLFWLITGLTCITLVMKKKNMADVTNTQKIRTSQHGRKYPVS